jgi:hypothetical protein
MSISLKRKTSRSRWNLLAGRVGDLPKEVLPEYPPDLLFQYDKIHPYVWERGLSREIVIEKQIGFSMKSTWGSLSLTGSAEASRYSVSASCSRMTTASSVRTSTATLLTRRRLRSTTTPHTFPRGQTLYNYDTASKRQLGHRS